MYNANVPILCICIPTYNVGITIHDTLISLTSQNYNNFKIKIIDNCSTDNTLKIVESFEDKRIEIHKFDEHLLAEGNFNRCIELSDCKYTAIYHADDVYDKEIIRSQIEYLENNERLGAAFCNALIINERDTVIGRYGLRSLDRNKDNIYNFLQVFRLLLKQSNFLISPTAMVRTRIYKDEIRHWNVENFKTSSDLDVWLRILQKHDIAILPERLITYRISDRQLGSAANRARTVPSDIFLVLEHYLKMPEVQKFLSTDDLRNYNSLLRTDKIVRAVNFFVNDDNINAKKMTAGILKGEAILAAFSGYRGFATFGAGILVHIFIVLRLRVLGKFVFRLLKQNSHRF